LQNNIIYFIKFDLSRQSKLKDVKYINNLVPSSSKHGGMP